MEGVGECPSGTARGIASRWASSGPPCGGRCLASHGVPGFCWCTLSTEARAAFATGSAGLVSGGASPPPWPASSLPLAAQVQERSDANVLPPTPAAERHNAGPDGRAGASGRRLCVRLWCDESLAPSSDGTHTPGTNTRSQGKVPHEHSRGAARVALAPLAEPVPLSQTLGAEQQGQSVEHCAPVEEERPAGPRRAPRRRRPKVPPWQRWRCSGCSRALPEGHSGCPFAAARSFDLDPRYGPASGLTRRERHARALGLGLKPPALSDEALSYPPTGAATRWL